jgi:uncharacterized RDD family membrane protein YckC
MRCPKCSYLSYDDVERCRNCGYDFALATPPREPEPLTPVEGVRDPRTWEPSRRRRPVSMDTPAPAEGGPLDLPLFEEPLAPEPPPVAIPPAGPPLSVRRKVDIARTPARVEPMPAPEAAPAASAFDWADEPTSPDMPAIARDPGRLEDVSAPSSRMAAPAADDLGPRLRAGVIDGAVLLATDLLVLWLTMRVAGVSREEWRLLPLVPLVGFLFLLDTAYLVTFTAASGQTIGKMLTGLRVVYGESSRVPFGHAVLRSVALLLCAIPAGLGLLPLFLDPERRGAHDRLAGTRVVPAA